MQPQTSFGLCGPGIREVRAWRGKSSDVSRKLVSKQGKTKLVSASLTIVGTWRRMVGGQGVLPHPEGKG
jgi:hypothetical protein